jgi:hypothetical protein
MIGVIAFQQSIEWLQLIEIGPGEWMSPVPLDEFSEPLSQATSLTGHLIQLTRQGMAADLLEHGRRHKLGLA